MDLKTTYDEMCIGNGVIDERHYYFYETNLLSGLSLRHTASGAWAEKGIKQREHPPKKPILEARIGMPGYYGGPKVIMVDPLALADPLLARLPMVLTPWRIGHFWRDIPEGYMEARENGDVRPMDPALGKYYLKLREIVSGDVWSLKRLKTIWEFNRGAYDGWLEDYNARHCKEFYRGCS